MTAFGRSEKSTDDGSFMVEIRCLNRRYCEISVRAPHQLATLEDRIKKLVGSKVLRGRADVSIKARHIGGITPKIEVNIPLAKSYYDMFCQMNKALGIETEMSPEKLLDMEGIITTAEPEWDLEKHWTILSECIVDALENIDAMRVAEGEAIYADFEKRLHRVEEGVSEIKALAPSVVLDYQDRLNERITSLTEGKIEIDPNRLAQEAAFLADKSDITEEMVRTQSHLNQFRDMMASEGSVGRSLDFLMQELNREINTVGSKAGDARMSHLVVNIKSELEKIREQVQNVE